VITEALITAVLGLVGFIDSLIPPVAWPDWLDAPADFFTAGGIGGLNLSGLFVFVHPIVYDIALLMLSLLAIERIVRRIRALVSTATGGGGVSQ
jgi:hypothetical protein